jgi:hypothetical protein
MDAGTIGITVLGEVDGVVVRVDLAVSLKDKPAPSIYILLHAHNICILTFQVIIDSVESLFILVIASILTDVIG